jgi:beta-glucosidase
MACTAAEDAELAVAAVAQNLVGADVAVVCVDARSGATDRELRLPAAQQQLLAQVIDSGIPTVVVAFGKTVFMLGDFLDSAAAVVVAWRPGEEGAEAVADVLSGAVNPSGRLPIALVRRTEQLPAHYNRRAGSSAVMDQPAYHFGHGLSYSSFEYGDPECVGTVDSHGAVELSVTITNTSELAGEEVVQLYGFDPVAEVTRPRRQLLGFQRLALAPGQSGRVLFQIDVSQFAYYNRQMEYVVDPGQIELLVGASSWDIRGRCQLSVEGVRRQIKQQQRLATQSSVHEAAS